MIFVVENEKQLGDRVWKVIGDQLKCGLVVGLSGNLGAGKTALVKQIAKSLGIKSPVASPTFNIRKKYQVEGNSGVNCLQHIDLYRIKEPTQTDLSEIKEWLDCKNCLTFVEWIDYLPNYKENVDLIIKMIPKGDSRRKVEVLWI